MNHLVEEAFERKEQREITSLKELLIKLRKEHLNSIVNTLEKLRRDKYLTKDIDKKVSLQAAINLLTEEYLQIESKLNQVETE